MKKYISLLTVSAFLWAGPMGVEAQTEGSESSAPPDINQMYKKIQSEIDDALQDSKNIPVPVDTYDSTKTEAVTPLANADDILDMVIPLANQDKAMDLEFDETALENILHTIEEVAGINIVLDPELKGKTMSLHLKNVKVHDALSIIAESYGLAFKKIGTSLYVTTKEKVNGDNMTSRLINLRYIKANEVREMAKNMGSSINLSSENNAVMVVGTPEQINKVQEMINKMDKPRPQVILEARIIEINKNALKNLGIQWSQSISTNFQESGRPVSLNNIQDAAGSALKIYSLARNPLQFNATLNILENDNLAKELSDPRVVTMNNKQAEIFVGDRIPYTVSTVYNGVVTNNVDFVEPGIRLKITPSIIDKDFVEIKISPEVSFIYQFIGPQNQYPWVKTRNATAYVRIKNGQPFVLGGLLDKEDTKGLFKVPILGDVPLLGKLFTYKTHTITDSELIITVVPVIVNQ